MYIEELMMLNFIIDYIILDTLNLLLKINTKKRKIILGSLFGEISLIIIFISINSIVMILFKLILGLLIIYITFGYKNKKEYVSNVVYFYILSFFLGGILYYFKINSLFKYKYYLLFIPIIMNVYKYLEYNLKSIINYKYKVSIYLNNGKIIYLNGFMDSGNTLIEPYNNNKVIIINKKIDEDFFLVPYETIDSNSLIKCFKPKKVYIDGIGQRNDIVVGVINNKLNGYECLLNYKLLEE